MQETRNSDSESSPEQSAVAREQMETVLTEINRMDESDQMILSYRYFLDLPTAEIAALLDMPHGTVRSRISRARQHLRDQLAEPDRPETDIR
ncbi:MAG: sigma-70 family RNA polymerase sigma factor [Thermomicrobiales bacterium]